MSISKEQAIEAIKTLKRYCGNCQTCEVEQWCDKLVVAPADWELPNE